MIGLKYENIESILTWQKYSYHIGYTCSKCAIYEQIIKSGMMGLKYLNIWSISVSIN